LVLSHHLTLLTLAIAEFLEQSEKSINDLKILKSVYTYCLNIVDILQNENSIHDKSLTAKLLKVIVIDYFRLIFKTQKLLVEHIDTAKNSLLFESLLKLRVNTRT